ncbi:MAG: DUF2484 family protein [Paracoccaceae bacterium]|nr:DUF2484 family protein [Paracoccaceae bacterium]MDE3238292.1 DUF2484 family protein [Paracoccaceae bacterium]
MTSSLILASLWAVAASLVALGPHRWHWPAAYALIAVGIPVLGYVTLQNGPVIGFMVLAGGVSILRWPMRFLGRWMVRQVRGPAPKG